MEKRVKGMFLKNVVEAIKNQKGPAGLEQLKQELGNITYYGIRDYPVEEEMRLHRAAMKVLYGAASDSNYLQLGKLSFETYVTSIIGKTMMALFKNDLKKLALSVKLAIDTISSGFEVEVEDIGTNSVKIILRNLPYPVEYYQGVWLGAVDYFKQTSNVKAAVVENTVLKPGDYAYTLSWK